MTHAFSQLSKSGSTKIMVTGCRWFHICSSTAYEVVPTPYVWSILMCKQLWMGVWSLNHCIMVCFVAQQCDPSFQPTVNIWINEISGNGLPKVPNVKTLLNKLPASIWLWADNILSFFSIEGQSNRTWAIWTILCHQTCSLSTRKNIFRGCNKIRLDPVHYSATPFVYSIRW